MSTVVLCSSRRFRDEAYAFLDGLEALGISVLRPPLRTWTEEEWHALPKDERRKAIEELTFGHFEKINRADAVFVYNKDGYSGVSVSLELGYAHAQGKPIFALEDDPEYARAALFTGIVRTPAELRERVVSLTV